jgi:hypothetical protein
MAWTAPATWTNSVLTAAQLNAQLRDNMLETAPAKATTAGSLFVGTGLNGIAERFPSETTEFASETTGSTAYANLPTAGPNVTVTTSLSALVGVTCALNNTIAGAYSCMSVACYTPTPLTRIIDADDNYALVGKAEGTLSTAPILRASQFRLMTIPIAQSNLFQGKYRVQSGTGTFDDRSLLVIPL